MNGPDSPPPPGRHTAFPALLAVFLAFSVSCAVQLTSLVLQNAELRRADASLAQAQPRARLVGTKIQAVTRDLLDLAPTSPGARQIVSEFEIRASPGAR